jgi:hypothetical protein
MVKIYNDRTTISKEHKIVIIGDSHSRGYAAEVKRFEETGLVKPGTGDEILVKSAMNDSKFN